MSEVWEWLDDEAADNARDEFELAMQDCGRTDEGWCDLAGTEHCDFWCPFRHDLQGRPGGRGP